MQLPPDRHRNHYIKARVTVSRHRDGILSLFHGPLRLARYDENGQVWNASQLGKSLGLSYHTVNNYLDYLVGGFLIRRLQPYQANIRKRLVKSPKVYWRDSGLLHALMNVPDDGSLLSQPWVGASWEGYVIEQILGVLSAQQKTFDAFYFRTSDRHELDLVLDFGAELWAIEIKLTASPGPDDMARLIRVADMIKSSRYFLISQTRHSNGNERRLSCNLAAFLDRLTE